MPVSCVGLGPCLVRVRAIFAAAAGSFFRLSSHPARAPLHPAVAPLGQALSSVVELNGWPVRLSIDEETLSWSVLDAKDQCLPLPIPITTPKHRAGDPGRERAGVGVGAGAG